MKKNSQQISNGCIYGFSNSKQHKVLCKDNKVVQSKIPTNITVLKQKISKDFKHHLYGRQSNKALLAQGNNLSVDNSGDNSGGKGGGSGSKPKGTGEDDFSWFNYTQMLLRFPLLTKMATMALLNAVGDIVSQVFLSPEPYNFSRTCKFSSLAIIQAPALHYWYDILGVMMPKLGLSKVLESIAKVGIDQALFTPIALATFYALIMTLENKRDQIKAKLKQDFLPSLKMNWCLWIPTQFLNFRYVPLQYQVLCVNFTALIWNTYLSKVSYQKIQVVEDKV